MFTVALIGPDGAGKTTVARRLETALPFPAVYLYMGINPDASNRQLPTTRIVRRVKRLLGAAPDARGPRDPDEVEAPRPGGAFVRVQRSVRSAVHVANLLAEEWYRQALVWSHSRRGAVVIFDRHFFFDYYTYDVAGGPSRPLGRRAHGFLLDRLYPKPELVVYLDAPADVLFARKGEGTLELLERRRRDYLALGASASRFEVVDANRPLDDVVDNVAAVIVEYARQRGHDGRERDHV